MIEWRVTNGAVESLYQRVTKEEAVIAFEQKYGPFNVQVYPVTDLEVKEMPQTLAQREAWIMPNWWNFCRVCKLQFCTFHLANNCHRCGHIKLERRVYNGPKNPIKSKAKRGNDQGSFQSKDRSEEERSRLRDHQTKAKVEV